jgi:alpha-mannosidase
VQGWVDFNNGERGVTIATPENPLVQLGDFHFAHNQREISLERAMFLGWVTNNYWETNFPGAQPGTVTARYAILPYVGDFDEFRAHKFAAETEHSRPLVQHLGEPAAPELLPASGTLFKLPGLPILTLNLRAEGDSALVTLFNASDVAQTATVSSGLIQIKAAHRCDLFGNHLDTLAVNNGVVAVAIAPRQTKVLSLM